MNRLNSNVLRSILRMKDLSITQVYGVHHHMERGDLELFLGIKRSNKAKANRNTHKNERMFRKLRGQKTMILDLPDDAKTRRQNGLSPFDLRCDMLNEGINPYKEVGPRNWEEHQLMLQSAYSVIDPYVPGERVLSFLNPLIEGKTIDDKINNLKLSTSFIYHNLFSGKRQIRKKKGYEKFDPKQWAADNALKIYENAYKTMMTRNKHEICKYITEHAFSKLWPDVENGSVFFELVEMTSKPKVISVRCVDNPPNTGNSCAQIIVKLCTKQKLAVFDRFGQLILGSKDKIKEVKEYVVFENHIADLYGKWRLHDKVYPKFADETKEVSLTTGLLKLDESSKNLDKPKENYEENNKDEDVEKK